MRRTERALLLIATIAIGAALSAPGSAHAVGVIAGRVRSSQTMFGLSNVKVQLYHPAAFHWDIVSGAYDYTDADGNYRIPNLTESDPGDLTTQYCLLITPSSTSYAQEAYNNHQWLGDTDDTVQVTTNATATCNVYLSRAARVRVKVVSEHSGIGLDFKTVTMDLGMPISEPYDNANPTGGGGYAWFEHLWPSSSYHVASVSDIVGMYETVNSGSAVHTFTCSAGTTKTVTVSMHMKPENIKRVSGSSRAAVAAAAADDAFGSYSTVGTVMVASGDDAASADPLAAAGLAGIVDAPLLLVTKTSLPDVTRQTIDDIPNPVHAIVVGGTASVPDSVMGAIDAIPNVSVERVAGADRYATAGAVATRSRAYCLDHMLSVPETAVVACGESNTKFFDSLALGPVCYRTHYPLLLVRRYSIPSATQQALANNYLHAGYIAGGAASVSESVRTQLGVASGNRLAGADRYQTAVKIAQKAVSAGWLGHDLVGFAATMPDALAATTALGKLDGALVLTKSTSVPGYTATYAEAKRNVAMYARFYGGTGSLSSGVRTSLLAKMF